MEFYELDIESVFRAQAKEDEEAHGDEEGNENNDPEKGANGGKLYTLEDTIKLAKNAIAKRIAAPGGGGVALKAKIGMGQIIRPDFKAIKVSWRLPSTTT